MIGPQDDSEVYTHSRDRRGQLHNSVIFIKPPFLLKTQQLLLHSNSRYENSTVVKLIDSQIQRYEMVYHFG